MPTTKMPLRHRALATLTLCAASATAALTVSPVLLAQGVPEVDADEENELGSGTGGAGGDGGDETEPAEVPVEPPVETDERPAKTELADSAADANTQPTEADTENAAPKSIRDSLRLGIGAVSLKPIVLIQAHATPLVGDDALVQNGDLADRGGFRLRRGRFGLAGEIAKRAAFAVSGEVSSDPDGELRIHDAWLGYVEVPYIQGFAGARRVPFSHSAIQSPANTALLERPLSVRSMSPGHQMGATVSGEIGEAKFGYEAGVYNGFQRSPLFYEGYEEGLAPLGNRFDGLAYAARLTTQPVRRMDTHTFDLAHSDFGLGLGGSVFFSDGGARNVTAAGGDLLIHVMGFHLLAEGIFSQAEPESAPTTPTTQIETVTSFGVVGEAGYTIIKETLAAAARFETIDPNVDIKDEADNWLVTFGASFFTLERILRASIEYTHREEQSGQSLDNDTLAIGVQLAL